MSLAASAFAYSANVGNPLAKLVLIGLADFADEEGALTLPPKDQICAFAECSIDELKEAMGFLFENGFYHRISSGYDIQIKLSAGEV